MRVVQRAGISFGGVSREMVNRDSFAGCIEELMEAPVALLSTSPDREDTILVRDPSEG